ncbi:hypothetical protein BDV96DRAFT_259231 [Lophiotrema nucula]|uniref:Fungal N-terminal domain-containing protein n=1 Tax=Lophiotrema nucula TaxID=690887 RepID=A0A6A5YP15_9PLEO|nr:hypothetical protein BDV96DRAFT_259231 [Lophiotrema nucula]
MDPLTLAEIVLKVNVVATRCAQDLGKMTKILSDKPHGLSMLRERVILISGALSQLHACLMSSEPPGPSAWNEAVDVFAYHPKAYDICDNILSFSMIVLNDAQKVIQEAMESTRSTRAPTRKDAIYTVWDGARIHTMSKHLDVLIEALGSMTLLLYPSSRDQAKRPAQDSAEILASVHDSLQIVNLTKGRTLPTSSIFQAREKHTIYDLPPSPTEQQASADMDFDDIVMKSLILRSDVASFVSSLPPIETQVRPAIMQDSGDRRGAQQSLNKQNLGSSLPSRAEDSMFEDFIDWKASFATILENYRSDNPQELSYAKGTTIKGLQVQGNIWTGQVFEFYSSSLSGPRGIIHRRHSNLTFVLSAPIQAKTHGGEPYSIKRINYMPNWEVGGSTRVPLEKINLDSISQRTINAVLGRFKFSGSDSVKASRFEDQLMKIYNGSNGSQYQDCYLDIVKVFQSCGSIKEILETSQTCERLWRGSDIAKWLKGKI